MVSKFSIFEATFLQNNLLFFFHQGLNQQVNTCKKSLFFKTVWFKYLPSETWRINSAKILNFFSLGFQTYIASKLLADFHQSTSQLAISNMLRVIQCTFFCILSSEMETILIEIDQSFTDDYPP